MKGVQWVDQCLHHCLAHHPEPRSGLCPELLADFRIPNLLGARRGPEGSFLCSLITDFLAEGAGVGSLPRAWRASWGARRCVGAKKNCEVASVFRSPH